MIVKLLRWSKEKEEYLIKNWKKYDDIYLGNQLGCTEQAVEAKRRRLKLFRVEKKIRNTKNIHMTKLSCYLKNEDTNSYQQNI